MNEIDRRGELPSKVHCESCMKIVKEIETNGFPTSRAVETLQFHAIRHEQKFPGHTVSVIIYRANLN